eukprot:767819-Hanusia_phi.AAC.2
MSPPPPAIYRADTLSLLLVSFHAFILSSSPTLVAPSQAADRTIPCLASPLAARQSPYPLQSPHPFRTDYPPN